MKRRGLLLPSLTIVLLLFLLRSARVSPSIADIPGPVLVLTAHPDDECMFFAPSILGLRRMAREVYGLCLSVGNADGLGDIRRNELVQSYNVLGVKDSHVQVINQSELQDNIKTEWNTSLVAEITEEYIRRHRIASIITFDAHGISSHPNHISLFHSAQLIRASSQVRVWTLHTTGVIAKYTGYVGAIWPLNDNNRNFICTSGVAEYVTALQAMRKHWSQLVWFRWLYVGWSRYMWVNELREIVDEN